MLAFWTASETLLGISLLLTIRLVCSWEVLDICVVCVAKAHITPICFMQVQLYLEVIAYLTVHAAYFLSRQMVVSVEHLVIRGYPQPRVLSCARP